MSSFVALFGSTCCLVGLLVLLCLFVVYDFYGVAFGFLWVLLICMLTVGFVYLVFVVYYWYGAAYCV